AAFLVYRLARRRAESSALPIAAGVLLCLDPGWGFRTASGVEGTLFAASGLLALDALDRRAWPPLGAAPGAPRGARPEGLGAARKDWCSPRSSSRSPSSKRATRVDARDPGDGSSFRSYCPWPHGSPSTCT